LSALPAAAFVVALAAAGAAADGGNAGGCPMLWAYHLAN